MIRKALALRIYDAANMQRWNDKICPVELRELDKQAHKMVIAYMLGKFEEQQGIQLEQRSSREGFLNSCTGWSSPI